MMPGPTGCFRDFLLTDGTEPALGTPQGKKLLFTPELIAHTGIQSFLEVGFPLWVVRIGTRFNFDVTPDGSVGSTG